MCLDSAVPCPGHIGAVLPIGKMVRRRIIVQAARRSVDAEPVPSGTVCLRPNLVSILVPASKCDP